MRVRYTPQARSDLDDILEYLSTRSPQGARNVKRALRRTLDLIGRFPESGRVTGEQGTRVLPLSHYPYLVYWIVEDGQAWVVHIRHGARRPWRQES